MSIPWIEKYRPKTLSDLILPKDKLNMLREFFKENQFPNLLFYGPPGVGKTSTILSCAKQYYGPDSRIMAMELNASDDRGIDIVRTKIKDFATSLWSLTNEEHKDKPKLIILDEVDGISMLAQSALLVEMESNMANARFCLICNNVNKLNPAIQSRCLRLRFSPLTNDQMYNKLKEIINLENVIITEDGIHAIIKLSGGDMRNALNILQQLSLLSIKINSDIVYKNLSLPLPTKITELLEFIKCHSLKESYNNFSSFMRTDGIDLDSILQGIHEQLIIEDTQESMGILDKLGEIETRIADGCSTKLQLGELIGALI
jgi:replication factor C subunit 3/5